MKWNSIVVKMGSTIIILLLLVLFPLGYIVNQIFSGFYFKEVQEQLDRLSSKYAESIHSLEDQKMLTMYELLGNMTEQEIVIVDKDGLVVANSGSPLFQKGALIDTKMMESLLRGEELQGLKIEENSQTRYFLVGKTIYDREGLIGGLFVMTSVEGIYDSLQKIRNLIILAGVGTTLLAMGFTFIVSRKLTNPLLEIEKATRKIAKGNFSTRLEVSSQDEIGNLVMAINEMAKELHRIQTTRSEFFANISHELRTPIKYLEGYARAVREEKYQTEDEKNEYLMIIEQETKRMTKLVGDLFELSKIEEGKLDLQLEVVNLYEVVERAVSKVKISAQDKGLEVVLESLEENPLNIVADKIRVEQILLNMIENAVRYTDDGVIHIKCWENGPKISLSIKDTGIGIPENEIPYLFERFHRVEKSRSRKHGGTGLGLSIVKQLVQLQHGTIKVESKVGEGTEFQISFPQYKEVEHSEES
jgi:signal transduction histidine kinase